MSLINCYEILGLEFGASESQIKSSYRQLARLYHPDVNQDDPIACDKFIEVTNAYKTLLEILADRRRLSTVIPVIEDDKVTNYDCQGSSLDEELKWSSYNQLQQLLKSRRFPRAITLVEGLASRLPDDIEVRQWQAITYQRCARQLVRENDFDKASKYLKKALRTDPSNRSLWVQVEEDLRRIEELV